MALKTAQGRKSTKKKIYYAHALCMYDRQARMYGWRGEERVAIQEIHQRFSRYRLVNPARYENHPDKQADGMHFCMRLIEDCDLVVFSRLQEKITSGVGKEINHALKIGKPVYELRPGGRCVRVKKRQQYLSRQSTVRLYDKWRSLQKMPRSWYG